MIHVRPIQRPIGEPPPEAPPLAAALLMRGFATGMLFRGLAARADVRGMTRLAAKSKISALIAYDDDGSDGEAGPHRWPALPDLFGWCDLVIAAPSDHRIHVPACRLLLVHTAAETVPAWGRAAISAGRRVKLYPLPEASTQCGSGSNVVPFGRRP